MAIRLYARVRMAAGERHRARRCALDERPEPAIGTKAVLEDRYPERRVAFPGGVTGLPDLTYSTVSGFRPLTLDLYLPASAGQWRRAGDHLRARRRLDQRPYAALGRVRELAGRAGVARGQRLCRCIAQLSVERRGAVARGRAGRQIGGALAARQRRALRRRQAPDWNLGRLGRGPASCARGHELRSRGAGTAASRMPKHPLESDCVQAVVAWYGVFDFAPLAKNVVAPPPVARYLGLRAGSCARRQDRARERRSVYLDRTDPPFLLIHGALDKTVAVSQSERFHAALQASAVKSQLHRPAGRRPQLRRQHRGAHAQREPARAARHDRFLRHDARTGALTDLDRQSAAARTMQLTCTY